MKNFESKQPTKTLDTLWSETRSELKFKIAAVADHHEKEAIQEYFIAYKKSLTPLQRRRLRKKRIIDILEAMDDDRTLPWIAKRLFMTKQAIYDFYKKRIDGHIIMPHDRYKRYNIRNKKL